MVVKSVVIHVPEDMEPYLPENGGQSELIRNAMILYPSIRNLTISYGRAAEILGIPKLDLLDLYAELGIPYLDMDIRAVEEDLRTFESIA